MAHIYDLGNRIEMIDLHDMNFESRTGSYIIREEKLTIVETSASPSIPYLLEGLQQLNIDPKDIDYIIITHVHLDHAGGVGLFLEKCPNAKVIVHPRGHRHLADPTKLIAGARAVYGEDFDRLYDPILPVPEDRLIIKEHQDTLQIGENCELTFYDTPGHARHHFSIYDPVSNGIFTGDTAGVYYQMLQDVDVELYLPTTTPNQYDPDAMLKSVELFESLKVDRIYFGHFGMSTNPSEVYKQIREWTPLFLEAGKKTFEDHSTRDMEQLVNETIHNLTNSVMEHLKKLDIPQQHSFFEILKVDMKLCSMGLVDYLLKQNA